MAERKLVGTNEMFKKALAGGYAIGAYNVNNMEILQAIAEAAEETRSPIILQVSAGARKYANQTYLVKLVEAALATTTVPIALHLDHGADFEICKACIDGGFSSVMIDGSRFSFEENVAVTKKVVEYAHERGVSVEAELGKLAGVEDDVNVDAKDAKYTNVKEAVEFVKQTGCDSLAIAIGTSHGAYKFSGEAKLDFDRLKEIKDALKEAGFTEIKTYSNTKNHCTVLLQFLKSLLKNATNTAETFLTLKAYLKICLTMLLNTALLKSTSIQT